MTLLVMTFALCLGCDDFGIDNIEEWTINNLNRGDEEADVIVSSIGVSPINIQGGSQ